MSRTSKSSRKRWVALTWTALCLVSVLFLAGLYKFSPRLGPLYETLTIGGAQVWHNSWAVADALPSQVRHWLGQNGLPFAGTEHAARNPAQTAPIAGAEASPPVASAAPGESPFSPTRPLMPEPWYMRWSAPVKPKGAQTYLMLGVDSRTGEKARSDTIMLATVPNAGGKVHLLSIPRDTYVPIPGHGYTKINHAMVYGGVPLVKQTVERFMQVPIDHTVVVDFAGFRQAVDELGGLDMTVEKNMDYDDPTDGTHIHLRQGQRLNNGKEALDYARFRHDAEADTGRMKRQQLVIRAMMQKGTRPAYWGRMLRLLDIVGHHVQTDIPVKEWGRMVLSYASGSDNRLETLQLAGTNKVSPNDQLWYFYVNEADRQKISRQLQELRRGNE